MNCLADAAFTVVEALRVRYHSARQKVSAVAAGYTAVQHITFAAYATMAVGVLETVMGLAASSGNGSDGVLSITILGLAETVGGALVLYRWKFTSDSNTREWCARREVQASATIAFMLQLMGTNLLVTSLWDLATHAVHTRLAAGIWVALFGGVTSLVLYRYKMHYGEALGSMVVVTDAHCSRCTGYVSASVALALMLQRAVWWADSLLGLLLAIYIIYDGTVNMQAARAEWAAIKLMEGAAAAVGVERTEPLLNSPERHAYAEEAGPGGPAGSQSIIF